MYSPRMNDFGSGPGMCATEIFFLFTNLRLRRRYDAAEPITMRTVAVDPSLNWCISCVMDSDVKEIEKKLVEFIMILVSFFGVKGERKIDKLHYRRKKVNVSSWPHTKQRPE